MIIHATTSAEQGSECAGGQPRVIFGGGTADDIKQLERFLQTEKVASKQGIL
jgi:hypothetical protein